jgi:hypothetical protein
MGLTTIELALPCAVVPAGAHDVYLVSGRSVGRWVEISLALAARQRHLLAEDSYEPVQVIAMKRFARGEIAAYSTYAGHLEDAARVAARGELGYSVHTPAEDGTLVVCLVTRLLDDEGRVHTEISHEQSFEDPESTIALVQANERATELRAIAQQMNEQWASLREARLLERQAQYDEADRRQRAADELEWIVNGEIDR